MVMLRGTERGSSWKILPPGGQKGNNTREMWSSEKLDLEKWDGEVLKFKFKCRRGLNRIRRSGRRLRDFFLCWSKWRL